MILMKNNNIAYNQEASHLLSRCSIFFLIFASSVVSLLGSVHYDLRNIKLVGAYQVGCIFQAQ